MIISEHFDLIYKKLKKKRVKFHPIMQFFKKKNFLKLNFKINKINLSNKNILKYQVNLKGYKN